jgi:hypothetical protein
VIFTIFFYKIYSKNRCLSFYFIDIQMLPKNKTLKFISKSICRLGYHIIHKPTKFFSPSYYYVIGFREKYTLLNISVLVESLNRIKKLIKLLAFKKNTFCFTTFNPLYFSLVKSLAVYLNQNYIVGS